MSEAEKETFQNTWGKVYERLAELEEHERKERYQNKMEVKAYLHDVRIRRGKLFFLISLLNFFFQVVYYELLYKQTPFISVTRKFNLRKRYWIPCIVSGNAVPLNSEKSSCFFAGGLESNATAFPDTLLENEVEKLVQKGVRYFYIGGTLEFASFAKKTMIRLRKKHPEIKLIVTVPFRGYDETLNEKEKRQFDELLIQADTILCLTEQYYENCWDWRYYYMANICHYCICYLTNEYAYMVAKIAKFSQKGNLNIINIADYEIT